MPKTFLRWFNKKNYKGAVRSRKVWGKCECSAVDLRSNPVNSIECEVMDNIQDDSKISYIKQFRWLSNDVFQHEQFSFLPASLTSSAFPILFSKNNASLLSFVFVPISRRGCPFMSSFIGKLQYSRLSVKQAFQPIFSFPEWSQEKTLALTNVWNQGLRRLTNRRKSSNLGVVCK